MPQSDISELLAIYEQMRGALESADKEFRQTIPRLMKNVPEKTLKKRLRSWLPPFEATQDLHESDYMGIAMLGELYVTDSLLFERSASGRTAIDRYLKTRGAQASELVRASAQPRLYIGSVRHVMENGAILSDLLDDTAIAIHTQTPLPMEPGEIFAVRALPWPADAPTALALAPMVPLDGDADDMLQSLRAQETRPGAAQSERILQRLYRQFLRHGIVRLLTGAGGEILYEDDMPGGDSLQGAGRATELFPPLDLNDDDPLDRLIKSWAAQPPSPSQHHLARLHATADGILHALIHAMSAREHGPPEVAQAARLLARVLAETLQAREQAGLSGRAASPTQIRGQIRENLPRAAQYEAVTGLYDTLLEEIRIAGGDGTGQVQDPQMARVLERIQALRMRTTEQGFTEEEAYTAARKLADLLDRYGAALSDADLARHHICAVHVETGQRKSTPLQDCAGAIATFCDCRVWMDVAADNTRDIVFFGMEQDAQAAVALYELVGQTLDDELAAYKRGAEYRSGDAALRRRASHAFSVGLTQRIAARLGEMQAERQQEGVRSSGRDLVVLKSAEIDRTLEQLGINFVTRSSYRRMSDHDAFRAGVDAAERFEI